MGFGLFGKLPQKRDFVAFGIPNAILNPFETWLQSAVAASRSELGREWERHYLVAPIWRFWIGPEIFGQCCEGAMMPSVDKVGRFFPLTIMKCHAQGAQTPPPPFEPRSDWFASIEERLLSVLGDDASEIQVDALAAGLADARSGAAEPGPKGQVFKGGTTWQGEMGSSIDSLVASLIDADYWRAAATRSFWWTGGGSTGRPVVHAGAGLPDPYFFSRMLLVVPGGAGNSELSNGVNAGSVGV